MRFERTEDAYPNGFEYVELAQHPAVVVVPYTKSVMSFFELYRMNVPGVGLGVRVRVRVRVRALPHERAALRANPNPHPDPHPDH